MDKESNFSEWYSWIVKEAEIADIRYPIKGMPVYRPYGFKMYKNLMKYLESLLDKTGHKALWIPPFIPPKIFAKETEHLLGFEMETFKIKKESSKGVEREFIVRPTSETPLYFMASLWIDSHRDLPLKIYMTNTVYRCETKMTRPLIRGREILWNEAHTFHSSAEEAEKQMKEAWDIYENLFDELCVKDTYVIVKRPEWDKFPGAEYTTSADAIMPDGKRLQIGTVHFLGQKFSKVFNIKFKDKDGLVKYVWQTCYGVSMRLLAYVISIHGDNAGLVLPFLIAPIKIVIVPIWYNEGEKNMVLNKANEIRDKLINAFEEGSLKKYKERWLMDNLENEIIVDEREDKKPSEKYFEYELKGVPLRIEIGIRDLIEGKLTIYRRDKGEKIKVIEEELIERVGDIIEDYYNVLRNNAKMFFESRFKDADTLEDAVNYVNSGYFVRVPFCSVDKDGEECAIKLKNKYKIEVFGTNYRKEERPKGKRCIICGREAKYYVYIGKSY